MINSCCPFMKCRSQIHFLEWNIDYSIICKKYFSFVKNVFMWVFCLYVCPCAMCILGACRGQKKVSDPLELELLMVVSCHARDFLWVLCKNDKNCWTIFPIQAFIFKNDSWSLTSSIFGKAKEIWQTLKNCFSLEIVVLRVKQKYKI